MLINTGSKLVAIDTGNGLGAFAANKGIVGQARGNMEAAGIDPKSVDIVLISHFHGDHIGGLKNADGTGLSECRDQSPGGGIGVLERRCQPGQGQRLQQGPVRQRQEDDRRAEVHHVRAEQGSGARHHVDRNARPHARPYVVRGGVRMRACWCRATSAIFLRCSCAMPTGRRCSTTTQT